MGVFGKGATWSVKGAFRPENAKKLRIQRPGRANREEARGRQEIERLIAVSALRHKISFAGAE
ncbi:MAG TPA: hypothetical protein DHK64_00155 [Rhodobiaceae bacterium]|nr:hypothetical protein [Rhodobiaceae bacterium]